MNMMSNSEDELFKDLLADYVSDTDDDGFSNLIIAQAEQKRSRRMRLRRSMLAGAFFFGGAIAGSQLSGLMNIFTEMTFLDSVTGTDLFQVIVISVFALTVWLSLDSRSVGYDF